MGKLDPNPWYRTRASKLDAPPKGAFHGDVGHELIHMNVFFVRSRILLMRFWQNLFLKGQTTSDETVLKIFITKQILLHNFTLSVFFSTRQYVTPSFFKHNFASILAGFGRFCWCNFGRIDFWRVKRRQMRLPWKFSLLTRYFSTTLLYQFF